LQRRTRLGSLTLLALSVVTAGLALVPAASAWTVTLTAEPKLKRTHHWQIEKSVSQPSVTLAPGETTEVTYSVTVTTTGFTDSDWAVDGNVTFSSDPDITIGGLEAFATPPGLNAPQTPGTITGCVPSPFPVTLVSGLVCGYSIALPNANPGDAHVIADVDVPPGGRHVETPFDFSTATVEHVDECVAVTDTMAGSLGTVCVGDSPKTFTYTKTIGPFGTCGPHVVSNTSAFTTNDTGATGSASANVDVTVPCGGGCTRTIGYWKTHAGFGPQADAVTPLLPITLGTAGGAKSVTVSTAALAVQLLSMRGTNDVHDSSNGINKLYAQLLGAKLNAASGADTSAVAGAIAAADAFLATHDTLSWSGLSQSSKNAVLGWAAALDDYNNGLVGPDHCD
jgi:hypothetical protein